MLKKVKWPFTAEIAIDCAANGFSVVPIALADGHGSFASKDLMYFASCDYYTNPSLPRFIEALFQGTAEVPESWIELQNSLDKPVNPV